MVDGLGGDAIDPGGGAMTGDNGSTGGAMGDGGLRYPGTDDLFQVGRPGTAVEVMW